MFNHICIVGCGLIGGSFALGLRRAGIGSRFTACGGLRSAKLAVERGVVDAMEESFDQGGICQADLIYLAAPIGGIVDFLRTRSKQIKPGAVVTDAGSTKVEITRVARDSLSNEVSFIGGHPMAGSEHTGVEYAHGDLFEGATYALMNVDWTDQEGFERLKTAVEAIGARTLVTDPESHDRAVALISHLPQLTASALAALLGDIPGNRIANRELAQRLAATGWRDMTRLAGSSWSVWRDICLTNQINISNGLEELIKELQSLKEAMDGRDFNRVRELFEAANRSVNDQRTLHYQRFEKL